MDMSASDPTPLLCDGSLLAFWQRYNTLKMRELI